MKTCRMRQRWSSVGLMLALVLAASAFPQHEETATANREARASLVAVREIERIRVGERVMAEMPPEAKAAERRWLAEGAGGAWPSWSAQERLREASDTAVDPATWKRIRLQADQVWEDGTVDDIHIETLQPPEWIAAHQAVVGQLVPVPLDLVEMGLQENLLAKVLAIERCPPIPPGPGRVVLTTVHHLNATVRELTVQDAQGLRETIRPTASHKFYSVTRDAWLSAADLEPGEQLHTPSGPATLLSSRPLPGTHRVYNFTVEGERSYHVSPHQILVHNVCPFEVATVDQLLRASETFDGLQIHHVPQAHPAMQVIKDTIRKQPRAWRFQIRCIDRFQT